MGRPFSPQNCPFSISSAVVAGLTIVICRQTDHATRSVTVGCIYVRSTAMQPKNESKIVVLDEIEQYLIGLDKY